MHLEKNVLLIGGKLLLSLVLGVMGAFCFAGTVVYVSNADSQDISVFRLNESAGHGTLLQTIAVGGAVMPMALSPDKTLLYAAVRSTPYRVVVFSIDQLTGALTQRGSAKLSDSMANISIDPDGRYLLAASYGGNKISVGLLDERGIPTSTAQVLATGINPHQITADPENKFVYVSLLGDDQLAYYAFNKTVGALKLMAKPALTLPAGSGPRYFVFAPRSPFLYVLNELSGNVNVFQRDMDTGKAVLLETHSLLPAGAALKPWAADIHLTPDGQFLYASERSSNTLSGFKVNKQNGRLSLIKHWTTESQPRAFNISPNGRFLVVVGQTSNQMTVYLINPVTGELKPVDRKSVGMNPGWVEVISLPEIEQ
jgi:6-phosphogluconolactonase